MSTEHSHEHFPEGASCCSGSCGSGSCCCSGDAIGPVPAVLGIALFISALAAGGDSLVGMAAYVGSYLLIGWDVLKAAFLGMMRGRAINENFLMSIASLGAMFLGDYSEAVGVMLFYRVGEYLQERAVGSSRRSVSELMSLRPEAVHVKKAGAVDDVPPSEVLPGSLIEVRPGERVPLDGVVTGGFSVLDTSAMTGESLPVEAGSGSPVLAGYINGQGVLEVRTERDWRHSALARVQELVEAASGRKSPLEGRLSSFSRIYTPLVISMAALVFLLYPLVTGGSWADGLFRALVLLVISCPCVLGLATPIAIMVGTGRGARLGILCKSAGALEALSRVDTVVFDKTGTLTEGEPRVVAVLPEEGMDADALVEMAAALEQGSEHPVGKAVYEHARLLNLPVRAVADLSVVPGRGIAGTVDGVPYAVGNSGFMQDKGISWKEDESRLREFMRQGASPLYVGRGGCPAGVIMVADSLKPDSRAAVDSLKRMNLRVVMLTGDNAATARHMAGELHIDEVVSDVLPDEKASHVMKMEERGDKVAMVGDGVNDAPALACARVGISMKSGTELAMESSDIVLMKSNPAGVAEAVQLGRTTLLIIRQNLFWAFFYNIIGIPLAAGCLYPAFGLTLNPMIAAGAMSLSSLCVVFNSLRLRGFTPRLGSLGK